MEEGIIVKEGIFKLRVGKKYYKLDWFSELTDEDIDNIAEFTLMETNPNNIDKLFIEGKELRKQRPVNANNNTPQQNQNNMRATAPYNFISLNHSVVASEWMNKDNIPTFDKWHEGLENGYIDFDITNLSDLFIGNETLNQDNVNTKQYTCLKDEKGNPFITASSQRGMIKNIMEILAYSKISQVVNKTLFYRSLSSDALGKSYNSRFIDSRKVKISGKEFDSYSYKSDLKAGYLYKENNNYYVLPAKKDTNGQQYYRLNTAKTTPFDTRININNSTKEVVSFDIEGFGICNTFKSYEIHFIPKKEDYVSHFRYDRERNRIEYKLKYASIDRYAKISFTNSVKGNLIVTGGINKKKHLHWIFNEPSTQSERIPFFKDKELNNIIDKYKDDDGIKEEADLFENLNNNNNIPCFYMVDLKEDGKEYISYIGHTALSRIPYNNTIHEHLPTKHLDTLVLDICSALFGKISKDQFITSRLNFTDALFQGKKYNDKPNISLTSFTLKPLGSPKPTSYPMYLNQEKEIYYSHNPKKVKNWNDKIQDNYVNQIAYLRGHKMYHQDTETQKNKLLEDKRYQKTDYIRKKSDPPLIQPLLPNNTFASRIYFDNLSKIELGALLLALQLNGNMRHQIGMGKPYGMGTIKIDKIKLVTIDRKKRYAKFLSDDNISFEEGVNACDIQTFITDFQNEVLTKLSNTEDKKENDGTPVKDDFWKLKRMQELAAIMNPKTNWDGDNVYIPLEIKKTINGREIKIKPWSDKRPLPYILDIVKQ